MWDWASARFVTEGFLSGRGITIANKVLGHPILKKGTLFRVERRLLVGYTTLFGILAPFGEGALSIHDAVQSASSTFVLKRVKYSTELPIS